MSTPEPFDDDLAKSYEDHLRSFESALDAGLTNRSPKRTGNSVKESRNRSSSVAKQSYSPSRERSLNKSFSPTRERRSLSRSGSFTGRSPGKERSNSNASVQGAMRANSQPGEVIIGFAAPVDARSESPEEKKIAQIVSKPVAAAASGASSRSSAGEGKEKEPKKGGGDGGKGNKKNEGKNDKRGPKVDMKSLSKAERRAIAQKEQELAKARKQQHGGGGKKGGGEKAASGADKGEAGKGKATVASSVEGKKGVKAPAKGAKPAAGGAGGAGGPLSSSNRVPFFLHLPDYSGKVPKEGVGFLHPEIVRLGAKYANGSICGSSARCAGLIAAFKVVVRDFKLPSKSEFAKKFYEYIRPMIRYIIECRPLSVSMGNMIRSFKNKITTCRGQNEKEGKQMLEEFLDEFLDERLLTAEQLICDFGLKKIVDGDVIITYACSYVVSKLLISAKEAGKDFRVIVVDSNPLREGKEFLNRLTQAGIDCTYVLLNGVCYMMKESTKVFLGAYALLSNGNLVSRVGTALVAMTAHEYNVPVIVCSETIKFSEKAMLDSITWNELGNPDELAKTSNDSTTNILQKWRDAPNLTLLSIYYDVTPREFITMIVCEFGMIPPTSVPVILREYGNPDGDSDT